MLFAAGQPSPGVWIVRQGQIELAVGSGRRHPLLLDMPHGVHSPRSVRVHLPVPGPGSLRTSIGKSTRHRWLSSVAQRVSSSQSRLIAMLGRPLPAQVAQLLLDEAAEGSVQLAQRTVAAMLGV